MRKINMKKNDNIRIQNKVRKIELDSDQLPILIVLKSKNSSKEYVLKTNKQGNGIFLNRREDL